MPATTVLRLPSQGTSEYDWTIEWLREIVPEADHVLLVGPGSCVCTTRAIRDILENAAFDSEPVVISSVSGRQFLPEGHAPAKTVPDTAFEPWPGPGVDLLVTRARSNRPSMVFSLDGPRFERRLKDVLGLSEVGKVSSR